MKIDWHPYPDEKPTKRGYYLVTVKSVWGNSYVVIDCYRNRWDTFKRLAIAWAELPEPYKPEEEQKCSGRK